MSAYRLVWRVVAGVLATVGISAGLLLSPAALLSFVGVAVIGTVLVVKAVIEDGGLSRGDGTGVVFSSGLAAGAATGALVGFAYLLGAGVVPLALCLLVTSPYAVKTWNRWRHSHLTPSSTAMVALEGALSHMSPGLRPAQALPEPAGLTDEQLCQAWRASYQALGDGASAAQIIDAVSVRQCLLDELERRSPRGLAAWFASGARAAGNPLPYLTGSRLNSPEIDWDELTRGQDC